MAFVSSAFERKIIPLRDERGALFIRDRNYGHHQISRGRRGRSRRILPSRPDCLNGISKICWKIDSRANVRTDTQPPGQGSEPHLDFVVTDLDGILAQLCGPGALGCGQGFRAARLQLRGVDLACFCPTRQPSGEFCGQTAGADFPGMLKNRLPGELSSRPAAPRAAGASAKASLMMSYLDALHRHSEEGEEEDLDVELNLSIPGQMDATELDRLARLAHEVAPNGCIVEVGSLFGQSSWSLAKNTPANATVYCLDPWVREPWMPIEERAGQGLYLETFRKNTDGLSNIIPLRGYSPREFVGWQRTIDLLFLGTARANPGLHYNLTFWAGFVRPGGWICGHAYCNEFPDVKTEVDRLAAGVGTRVTVAETLWSMRVPEDFIRYGV